MEEEAFTLQDLLGTGLDVLMIVDLTHKDIDIPKYLTEKSIKFENKPCVGLEIGCNIPDLNLSHHGVSCTLNFNRVPYFCYVPWEAIMAYGGSAADQLRKYNNKIKSINQNNLRSKRKTRDLPPYLRIVK